MIYAVSTLAIIGFSAGAILALASLIFHVKVDSKIQAFSEILPGVNCGACGYAGCLGYAEALANEKVELNLCTPGGKSVHQQIAKILGQKINETIKKVVQVACNGGNRSSNKYQYLGVDTCISANQLANGFKSCNYGCLGFGDCFKACPFDAITMSSSNLPIIDKDKCTACLKCIKACPKNLLNLILYQPKHFVFCQSHDKGSLVRNYCDIGCIGCGLCLLNCTYKAIEMRDNVAFIIAEKCTNCGVCLEKCPTKSINFIDERQYR